MISKLVGSVGLSPVHWLAVLRIGLGLWWLESWRHKDKRGWLVRGTGIKWAQSVAEKHKIAAIGKSFTKIVSPRPKVMAYAVVFGELAIGLGIAFGFLTPIALIAGLLLNVMYFVLMIHDWAEQGQNSMMALISVVCLFAEANSTWSLDHVFHIFGG